MVNILKHRKINKNPFVKFLKDFYENEAGSIKELSQTEGRLEHFLGNGRSIIIENGFLSLVNYEYYSLGCFTLPIEELTYSSGNIYFNVNPEDPTLKHDFQIFYSSKEEVYKLVAEFDSINNEHKFKEFLLLMQEVGLFKQKLNLG
ncbi:MAG: hypothetical protein IKG36_02710 [Mycoplasmataceae bacterium]|nr:hypothetical protein [Mycoplasmataceae bacterium]